MPQHDSDSISAAASRKRRPRRAAASPRARGGFLTVRNLVKRFGAHTALADVRWISAPASWSACWASGCGKTTLLRAIAGLERQDSGVITLSGRDISHAEPQERDYGILFQSYALFQSDRGAERRLRPERQARASQARGGPGRGNADAGGLAGAANKYPGQISGGQQQRVAWPARWRRRRPCCCWTNPCRRWTPACASTCASNCARCRSACPSPR